MSIRLKLLLSYAAMLVIPLVLIFMTAQLLIVVFHGDLQNIRDIYGPKAALFQDRHDERWMKEIKRTADGNPALLADPSYLDDLNQELANLQAGIIVRQNGRVSYVSPSMNLPELLGQLPPFGRPGHREEESPQRFGDKLLSLTQYDFQTPDGQPGSVFLVTTVNPVVNLARKFFPLLFGSLLIILVLTHSLLTYFVSRSIIRPLRQLRDAAKQIKIGNLDFQVGVSGKDEIGQLGTAFEEMRTQLKESVETQLLYEENRKELISNISHDLKTPITSIKGYVEGIQDGIADTPEKMHKYIETISTKAEEMDRLIDELFLYSKLDMKRLPFNFERVNISSFLQDCAEEMRFDLEKKGFRFDSEIGLPDPVWVSADRDKLKRVITNIIGNCLKYMDKTDKRIRFAALKQEGTVIVEVADNGQGIDPEALPYIFERFYRAEQSRNVQTGGSGLGLAIARQIVDGHGGTIRARSSKGEGTSIYISLPILADDEADKV